MYQNATQPKFLVLSTKLRQNKREMKILTVSYLVVERLYTLAANHYFDEIDLLLAVAICIMSTWNTFLP